MLTGSGGLAITVAVASVSWACTYIEGTVTASDTTPDNSGTAFTVSYSGGRNLSSNYPYNILLVPDDPLTTGTANDAECTGPARKNGVGPPAAYELGSGSASSGSFSGVSVTIPTAVPEGGYLICVYSQAIFHYLPEPQYAKNDTANNPDPQAEDYCYGIVAQSLTFESAEENAARQTECTQAELLRLPRRGQSAPITVV